MKNKNNIIMINPEFSRYNITMLDLYNFHENFKHITRVSTDGTYNYINSQGKLLSNIWFDAYFPIEGALGVVRKGKKCNIIDIFGNIVLYEWFDYIWSYYNGFYGILNNNKYNVVNIKNTSFTNEIWFDDIMKCETNNNFIVRLNRDILELDISGNVIYSLSDTLYNDK